MTLPCPQVFSLHRPKGRVCNFVSVLEGQVLDVLEGVLCGVWSGVLGSPLLVICRCRLFSSVVSCCSGRGVAGVVSSDAIGGLVESQMRLVALPVSPLLRRSCGESQSWSFSRPRRRPWVAICARCCAMIYFLTRWWPRLVLRQFVPVQAHSGSQFFLSLLVPGRWRQKFGQFSALFRRERPSCVAVAANWW